jgi:uncharacterized membrane protein YdjX (TVP38/TMEM64 family)
MVAVISIPGMIRPLGLVLLVVLATGMLVFAPINPYILEFAEWVRDQGVWGPMVLAAAYIPATVLLIPGSLLTLGAGFAFGVVRGTIAVSVGSSLGAATAFLVSRFLARSWVEERLTRNPKFQAIDRAVADQAFKIVLLTRLSPAIPFTLLNYLFGLTQVRFLDYLLASWIGMLPGTVMYAYLGSAMKTAADLAAGRVEGGLGPKILFLVGLGATFLGTLYVTRLARRAITRARPTDRRPETTAASSPPG